MTIQHLLRKDTYFDSVTLMLINNEIRKLDGVSNAVVGMGTDYNIESLKRLNLFVAELAAATPQDLVICVEAASEAIAKQAVTRAEQLLTERKSKVQSANDYVPPTQVSAYKFLTDSNVVLISVPGPYAAREAKIALENDKHVMMFSDNVTIDEERELKDLAVSRGLLMMGPDCGTAIINGVPLAFANAVRRGSIGMVAASGTGLQEVSSIIHQLGAGITQAIGVGGRDLSEKIAGRMTILAVQSLDRDPQTRVIVLISKPPAESTFLKLLEVLKPIKKPIVIYFIGADTKTIEARGFHAGRSLEDTARTAVKLASGAEAPALVSDNEINQRAGQVTLNGNYLRGLYSGGTLCDEAQRVLAPILNNIYSNTPVRGCQKLDNVYESQGHTIIDLGDDEFTRGRAHPMIDPEFRKERLVTESSDKSVGMIVFDVVLGYGSHADMAGEMVAAITKAANPKMIYAACICGTSDDWQGYETQKKKLEAAGVLVFPSNITLCTFASAVFNRRA